MMFFTAVGCAIFIQFMMVLRVVTQGQTAHRLRKSYHTWLAVYIVSGSLFLSIVTTLVRVLICTDATAASPAVLYVAPGLVCWQGFHLQLAWLSVIVLAGFFTQVTILPAGSYKETMYNEALDVVFVPVFLQAQFLLKGVFSSLYAAMSSNESAYDDVLRISALTLINLALLALNMYMSPCSLPLVNNMRTATFTGAVWVGISSLIWLYFHETESVTEWLLVTTCVCFNGGREPSSSKGLKINLLQFQNYI